MYRCLRCRTVSEKASWTVTTDPDTGVPDVRPNEPKCVQCGGRVVQE